MQTVHGFFFACGALGFVAAVSLAACAADPGDAAKIAGPRAISGSVSGGPVSGVSGGAGSSITGSATGTAGSTTGGPIGPGFSGASGSTAGIAGAATGTSGTASGATSGAIGTAGAVGTAGATGTAGAAASGMAVTDAGTGDATTADATFDGAGCAPGALVVVMPRSDSGGCGNTGSVMNGNGTLGAVCVEHQGPVPQGWNASNAGGCTITLTGGGPMQTPKTASAMPVGPDGYVYWNLTSGCIDYVAISCY